MSRGSAKDSVLAHGCHVCCMSLLTCNHMDEVIQAASGPALIILCWAAAAVEQLLVS